MTALLHNLIRFYCTHSPIEFGKGRLQKIGRSLLGERTLAIETDHDVTVEISLPEDAGWEMLYYRRTFETGTTEAMIAMLREDDVFVDIGANIGWYTLIASRHARRTRCHAFEPVPFIFAKARRNWQINDFDNDVRFNNMALGKEEAGELTIHTFEGLYHGHSSASTLDRDDYQTWVVPSTTLDRYVQEQGLDRVDIIKMDTEGGEMNVLQGAIETLSRPIPPVWIIEMNAETSRSFGHDPAELLDFLQSRADYRFFKVKRGWDEIVEMTSTADYRTGDNALCIPTAREDLLRKEIFGAGRGK